MNRSIKRVAILGSTGSIGTQALDVIARHPARFAVSALAAGSNVDLAIAQANRFRPPIVSIADAAAVDRLKAGLAYEAIVEHGARGLRAVAAESGAAVVLAATDGSVAGEAIMAAARAGVDLAIANKELIVGLGELLLPAAAKSGARVLPVDSEHSALFQCLEGERSEHVAALVLTASGGPFRTLSKAELERVTVEAALRHPTWQMGIKNTIDSATLMNKGLEVIEASRLFGIAPDRVRVVVHPQSIVHGMVVFRDGNVKAHLGTPDMRLPIGYALAYPDRLPASTLPSLEPLDLLGAAAGGSAGLTFEEPAHENFPALGLAYQALRAGGFLPAMLSAANEIAVRAFVEREIGFMDIPRVVAAGMEGNPAGPLTIESVREADAQARRQAAAAVGAIRFVPK